MANTSSPLTICSKQTDKRAIPALVLASSSPWRRELLQRLGLHFECASPNIDENPISGEAPQELALRLARQKAEALAEQYHQHWIIGSDQVACLANGELLGKPGTHANAVSQLSRSSGQQVTFYTSLFLLNSSNGDAQHHCEPFKVQFRSLSKTEIEAYLYREQPYQCAGAFMMEGLGITLFESLQGQDPNALIGLPLIALNKMLINWQCNPLLQGTSADLVTPDD
jgi:MAF protein